MVGFHKPLVQHIFRRLWCIPFVPIQEQPPILVQNRKAQLLVFTKRLCSGFVFLFPTNGFRQGLVRRKVKVRRQFSGRIIQPKVKQFGGEVDHIPMLPTGETVVVVIRYI